MISFPKIEGVDHEFVDILFKTSHQHNVGRDPKPKLRGGYDPLIPWLHAAYIDECEWCVIQVIHPYYTPNLNGKYSKGERKDLELYAGFFITALKHTPFADIGKVVGAWLLTLGFPHSEDVQVKGEKELVSKPEYVFVLKRFEYNKEKGGKRVWTAAICRGDRIRKG